MPVNNRLLFVITGLAVGGAETQMTRIATRLRQRGWIVRIVTLLPPKAYVQHLAQSDISVDTLNIRYKLPDPCPLLRLARIIRSWKPSIVHSHMVHANLLARITRFISPMPLLMCTAHNINEGGRLREILYRVTDRLCDLTTHVCREGAERYVRIKAVPAHKIRHVPNGVDVEAFRPDPVARQQIRAQLGVDDHFVWLAVGRLEAQKDYPNLLNAFATVRARSSAGLLLIAGDGPLRADMERLANTLGIQDWLRFLGMRRDIPQLMNAADACVLSSSYEGLPMVLLEAHSMALPIVATDVGGNSEIVTDGVTGLLVAPHDSDALAEAMVNLMRMDAHSRRQMGLAGRQHIVENYSMEFVIDTWEALYHELLEAKARGSRHRA